MPRPPKYTDEELLDEIRRVNDLVSRNPLRRKDFTKLGEVAHRTVSLRFGSWNAAVEAAGFAPRERVDEMERPPECPLCEDSQSGLDFHHWNYGDEPFGCYLCRDCHDIVHAGDGSKSNEDWLPNCVFNLIEAHAERGHPIDRDAIVAKYNLRRLEPLVEIGLERVD